VKVVSTEQSQVLGARIADRLGVQVADVRFSRFPDGEEYLRVDEPDDEMVVVGSFSDARSLVQLLLVLDACSESDVALVIPYMGYARQDRRFIPGEPVSARAVARTVSDRADRVFTVNIHTEEILHHFLAPAANLSMAEALGGYLADKDPDDPLILAPDAGAAAFAARVAAVGGWDTDHLEKTRLSGSEVRMEPRHLEADGREVVMVDDIIATGGTIATAAGMLRDQGASSIRALCVHAVLAAGAYSRLTAAGIGSIVATDTIERACSRITAADTIAGALRECFT